MPIFEVERRFRGHIQLPKGFLLKEKYQKIIDVYYTIDPQIRLRYTEVEYPEHMERNEITLKEEQVGEFNEIQYVTTSGSFDTANRILSKLGYPILRISGNRIYYESSELGMNLFHDTLDDLKEKEWTEVEILVGTRDDVELAAKRLIETIQNWGVDLKSIEPRTYAKMKIINLIYESVCEAKTPPDKSTLTCQFKCSDNFIDDAEADGLIHRDENGNYLPRKDAGR